MSDNQQQHPRAYGGPGGALGSGPLPSSFVRAGYQSGAAQGTGADNNGSVMRNFAPMGTGVAPGVSRGPSGVAGSVPVQQGGPLHRPHVPFQPPNQVPNGNYGTNRAPEVGGRVAPPPSGFSSGPPVPGTGQPQLAPPQLRPTAMAMSQAPPAVGTSGLSRPPPPSLANQPPSMNPASGLNQHARPPPFQVTSPSKTPASSSKQQNIDPSQMPRPSNKQLPTQVFETRPGGTHAVPPGTDVSLAVRDSGDAGPRYMRCSVNSVPQGHDMVKSSSIPIVLGIQPFALQSKGDSAIPLIDMRGSELVRCSKCNAYVCPFMKWYGATMTCCFCGGATNADQVVQGGAPSTFGTVEYIVDGKYQVREPMLPTYLFLIDCTAEAIQSGMTSLVCSSILALLGSIAGKDRARVGIVTFTNTVQFYQLKATGGGQNENAKMYVMSDVDDPFSPLSEGAFASLGTKDTSPLPTLLERIPGLFSEASHQSGESAGSAAIKACIETMKCVGGGRLLTFVHSLPHKGALALKPRESGKPPLEKDPLDVMLPPGDTGKQYAKLAKDAATHQISVDIFALTKSYVDLATLGILASSTSGNLYRYSPFSCSADSSRFYDELRWNLTRPIALEAVGKLRVSHGLSVDAVVGSFGKAGQNDLVFPAINSESTIFAKIIHDERLKEGSQVCLQYATLYSTIGGQRRVRVHSLALPVTRSLGSVFRGADLEIYMGYLARQAASMMPGKSIRQVKDMLNKAATGTLVAYRKHCATSSSSGQLILPESLKLIPLFCLGLSKLSCFRTDARADLRAVWSSRILSLPLDRLLPAVHPRLFCVPLGISKDAVIPPSLPLSAEKLESNEVYIMENGFDMFLHIGRDVQPDVVTQLLGTASLQSVDPTTFADLPVQENPLSKQTRDIISQLRRQRRSYMHMRLVVKGHAHETLFYSAMVEDRHLSSGMSYIEYLCYLHRQIQNKMT
jgi:protein transport protein SEC24